MTLRPATEQEAPFIPDDGGLLTPLLRKGVLEDMLTGCCPFKGRFLYAQESVMDYFFFFIGIISVACALTYIKKTSPNKHH